MSDERCELLISRVVDGQASPAEWDALSEWADREPDLWRTTTLSLRDHAGVARAVHHAEEVAAAVDLPEPPAASHDEVFTGPGLRRHWVGWAVAASVALAWVVSIANQTNPVSSSGTGADTANLATTALPALPAAELFQAYLDKGKQEHTVVGEVPEKLLIESRAVASGRGYELFYVRQIIERKFVTDLYEMRGRDETGRPIPVRYRRPGGPPM